MSGEIVNLVIQLIAGIVGGTAIGASFKSYDLGGLGNTLTGAIGGIGGGHALQALIPALAGTAGGEGGYVGAIVGQFVGSGVGGAVLTLIVGAVKNMLAKR